MNRLMKASFLKRLLMLVLGRTVYVWSGPRGVLVAFALALTSAPASLVFQTVGLLMLSAVAYVSEEVYGRWMRIVGIGHAAVHALLWVAGAGIVLAVVSSIRGGAGVWAYIGAHIPPVAVDAVAILAKVSAYTALLGYMLSTVTMFIMLFGHDIYQMIRERV